MQEAPLQDQRALPRQASAIPKVTNMRATHPEAIYFVQGVGWSHVTTDREEALDCLRQARAGRSCVGARVFEYPHPKELRL